MWEAYFYGAVLRMAQALLQSAPFLVAGLFVAGVLQRLLGRANTRKLFGGDTWRSIPQSWALGMLLPVCSFGVIPMVREMRRAGLSGGTILAFALAAPLFNPLSLLYGLTLSEPFTIFAFALCSLVVVTTVGLAWDWLFPNSSLPEEPIVAADAGIKRVLSIGLVGAREMVGPTLGYVVIGLLGVGALSLGLPPTSMQRTVQPDNPWAPMIMAAVAVPAYASPMTAMNQLGSMFQHGNSVGAAFTLLALGAGVNLGLVAWMFHNYGFRRAGMWFVILIAVVAALSYGVERPLTSRGIEIADHTHAFDGYCRPYTAATVNIPRSAWLTLRQDTPPHEFAGLVMLGAYFLAGLALCAFDPNRRVDTWIECGRNRTRPTAWYNRHVPSPAVGALALLVVIALSIVGCFAYYPPPSQAYKEISAANAEAVGAAIVGETAHAEKWIPIYEDWVRKLQVGIYLRGWRLNEYHRLKAEILLERLELLEHELAHNDHKAIRQLCTSIERSRSRLQTAIEEVTCPR